MIQVFNSKFERLAILDKAYDISCKTIYNGIYTANFSMASADEKNIYCEPFNLARIDGVLYRIMESVYNKTSITYHLEHVITTLIDDFLFQFHQIGNIGVFTKTVIEYVLNAQSVKNWRLGRCDFNHQFLYKWECENLLAALFDIPKPFSAAYHFTYDTNTHPWTVNLVRANTEIGCEIRYKKNMQGITKTTDVKNLVTRIYPLGYGEGDNQLTICRVNNGKPYIEKNTALYGIKAVTWVDRRFEDANNLKSTAESMLDRLSVPFVSFTVESIDLFQKTGDIWDKLQEGTIVKIIDPDCGLANIARIMEVTKPNIKTADISIVISNENKSVAGSIAEMQKRTRIEETYAQGSESLTTLNFTDNAEPGFPLVVPIYIPADMVNINKAVMRIELMPFRANSRAIKGGGGVSSTTSTNGEVHQTTASGGSYTSTTVSNTTSNRSTSSAPSLGETVYTSAVPISVNSTTHQGMLTYHEHLVNIRPHSHDFDIPGHNHGLNIPNHSHNLTIPGHNHELKLPDHSHNIEFGIFTGTRATEITIQGKKITDLNNIDLIPFLAKDASGMINRNQWHRLEIIPNAITRISANVFLNIFTNSRGLANN